MIGIFDINEWSYLWDGSEEGWVLWNIGSEDSPDYSIFNVNTRSGMLMEIEDDDYNMIINMMLSNGVRIVTLKDLAP